jgi:hypothetical protein
MSTIVNLDRARRQRNDIEKAQDLAAKVMRYLAHLEEIEAHAKALHAAIRRTQPLAAELSKIFKTSSVQHSRQPARSLRQPPYKRPHEGQGTSGKGRRY